MYDVSKDFRKFYKNCVVLQSEKQQNLRDKKDLNIKRLEDGLDLYNQEHDTHYAIAEKRVQGSMAMATVVQNDSNDYDIRTILAIYRHYKPDDWCVRLLKRNVDSLKLRQSVKLIVSEFSMQMDIM